MTDSGRHHAPEPFGSGPRVRQDAKIEDLLLAGLDFYFSARYEEAIYVWTRALFFDRGHTRARAYIERARRALAERQRESEELVHSGADAFRRGDVGQARTLLESAVERGGAHDDVEMLLSRLDRLDQAPDRTRDRATGRVTRAARRTWHETPPRSRRVRKLAFVGGVLVLALAALVAAASWDRLEAFLGLPAPPVAGAVVVDDAFPLPQPSASEIALERAQTLYGDGRFHEALRMLARVQPSSTVRIEADALQSVIQRALIAGVDESSTAVPPSRR